MSSQQLDAPLEAQGDCRDVSVRVSQQVREALREQRWRGQ